MSDKDSSFLKGTLTVLKTKCTRLLNKLRNQIESLDKRDCANYLDDLKELSQKLELKNEDIAKIVYASGEPTEEDLLKEEEYEDQLGDGIKMLKNHLCDLQDSSNFQTNSSTNFQTTDSLRLNSLKLPQMPLPEYSHADGENLELFLSNFENIIDKYNLSSYEKYIYLERQLKGEALLLVKSLSGNSQSFEDAKALLVKAFASPTLQKFEILEKLSNINLSYNGSPYVFISEMRLVLDAIKNLKIETEDVAQFFIWNGMPFSLQSQLINITNNNRPTIQEIEDNIFSAVERYLALQKRKPEKSNQKVNSVYGLAANVSVGSSTEKFKPCAFCCSGDKKADHSMSRCPRYPNPQDKLSMIKRLKLCVRCGNEHLSENCKFKFYRDCFHCKASHFSFLCVSAPKKENFGGSRKPDKVSVSNGMLSIEATTVNFQSNFSTILPNLSLPLSNNSYLHALKDSGAQCTLILNKIAEQLKFKVLDTMEIKINGINCSKPYKTKLVEVPVYIGGELTIISAICVPEINIKLKIKDLDIVVSKFKSNNLILADKTLCNSDEKDVISNIDLILGADNAQIVQEKGPIFPNGHCGCTNSILGVILMGPLDEINGSISNYVGSQSKKCEYMGVASGEACAAVGAVAEVLSNAENVQRSSSGVSHGGNYVGAGGNYASGGYNHSLCGSGDVLLSGEPESEPVSPKVSNLTAVGGSIFSANNLDKNEDDQISRKLSNNLNLDLLPLKEGQENFINSDEIEILSKKALDDQFFNFKL